MFLLQLIHDLANGKYVDSPRDAKQLARFKVPARVIPVDAFPVTESANGIKIQRGKLRTMAEEILRESG